MNTAPQSERIHITLFGLRNAGKSTLINALAGRSVAIVSDAPGTTTDPVAKAMELGELGPVVLTDTAGLDDVGELGAQRVARSLERLAWTDVALLATPLDRAPEAVERETLDRLVAEGRTVRVAATFADRPAHPDKEAWLQGLDPQRHRGVHRIDGTTGEGVAGLRQALASLRPKEEAGSEESPLEGLVEAGDLLVLVTPIDSAAPKGRLILPQAAVLRDALDRGCHTVVVRETELAGVLKDLTRRPRLVVTDSQAFAQVAEVLPADWPLTSFSILFARKKGELARYQRGLEAVAQMAHMAHMAQTGTPLSLLALEACTHNRTHEDIATVKIPALLGKRTGREVRLQVARELRDVAPEGHFDLAVICGGCMATGRRMQAQLDALEGAGIPVLNFGIFLAWAHGVFPRAVEALGGMEEGPRS